MRDDPGRGVGFEEALDLFRLPHGIDRRSDSPEQYRPIGWIKDRLYSVIFEVREDIEGEYWHHVTLWKATTEEKSLYEEHK